MFFVGCPVRTSVSGPSSFFPGVNFRCAAVLPRMKPAIFHLPLTHWKRGLSPKTQKSLWFGSGRLTPPSRVNDMVADSVRDSTGPRNFGPDAAPDAAGNRECRRDREHRGGQRRPGACRVPPEPRAAARAGGWIFNAAYPWS